jgi:hypothetical protein
MLLGLGLCLDELLFPGSVTALDTLNGVSLELQLHPDVLELHAFPLSYINWQNVFLTSVGLGFLLMDSTVTVSS